MINRAMINRLGVRPNTRVLAHVAVLALVGTLQVGCTSCLSTPRPAPTQRLEAALREESFRKASTVVGPTADAPLVCPSFGSSNVPAASQAPGGHRVILSWRASAPADPRHAAAVGYCIYRGLKQKDPSPALLNTTPFPGTRCADDLVVNDEKYYYVVRAISAKGSTSIVSNEAPAAIPKRSDRSSPAPTSAPLCRESTGLK
jgi:hypothetical protein